MDRYLLALLAFIAAMLLFSVPYLMWYGRVQGIAQEPGRRSDILLAVIWFLSLAVALYERLVLQWVPFGGWPLALGCALVVLGISGRLMARRSLGRYYLPQLKLQAGQQLITTGFYHYVRHPMYTAHLLIDIGLGLALSSVLGTLLMATGMAAGFIYRVAVEERLLAAQFGDEWQRYTAKTPHKLIPLVY